ncbi:hypothetical protein [Bradyrhizobium sp. WSM471]|uniref:hypothetical protein n=1 Tax=Bradyrhizobium sp. WSM471 TaxID=319017 RepID=UPI0018DED482|nr:MULTISPECIES: hypothetical protein [Bradyrhizobium]UFW43177.1 hypothetical protein BcanWSM471_08870 [Bradyrhizobium canariense]
MPVNNKQPSSIANCSGQEQGRSALTHSVSGSEPVACFCGERAAVVAKCSSAAINGLPIVLRNRAGPLRWPPELEHARSTRGRSAVLFENLPQGIKGLFATDRKLFGSSQGDAIRTYDVVANTLGKCCRMVAVEFMLLAIRIHNDVSRQLPVLSQLQALIRKSFVGLLRIDFLGDLKAPITN